MKYALVLAMTALAVGVQAQADRITLPRGPVPDQTVHMRTTQEFAMDLVPGDAGTPIPPLQMAVKTVMAETMVIGRRDERQRYQSTATVDEVTNEMTMNGAPMPMPASSPLKPGQQFTIQYDEAGAVVDVTGDAPGAASEMIKTLIAGVTKAMSSTTIAVGESITIPANMALPSLPTGPLGDMTGESKMTLASIAMDGPNHIAHFDIVVNASLTSSPQSTQPLKMDMQIKGSGVMEFNVERGLARSMTQTGTLDGRMSGGVMPEMKLHGTIKMSMQSTF
jgi:hypothetical protein